MSILATGAGASEGLKDYLMQMLREQQLAEQVRSNKADETYRQGTLKETARQHDLQAESNDLQRQSVENNRRNLERNRERDDLRAGLDDLLPGVMITPSTRDKAVETGAALPGRFEEMFGPFEEAELGPEGLKSYELQGKEPKEPVKGLQSEWMMLDGKPVPATFDPSTGRYAYQGQDITGRAQPYERPRGEDRVLIQTGDGWARRSDVSSKLAGGEEVPLPQTAEVRNRTASAGRVQPVLSAISDLSEVINTKAGPLAKMEGGMRRLEAMANMDDDVAEYMALIKGFTPMVARALGHVGVLTQQDVESVYAVFPMPGDSKSLRDRKIARVISLIGSINSDQAAPPAGGAGTPPPAPGGGAPAGGGGGFRVRSVKPKTDQR